MKQTIILILVCELVACKQTADNGQVLQARIDSLESKVVDSYKPGFGEFMSSIQSHHAKLWFAGQNENWKLADFEIHEIMEAIDDIKKYEIDRKESGLISMMEPSLDSVNNAIEHKDIIQFKNSYTLLTNTCNNCHKETDFEFNAVKIPDVSQFSNQEFKVKK
ncbi:MAG: hypothetical protein JWQ09_471 [Segetibacter sp.]|nr:hypothetical protein [Segetibacter sp.]